MPATTLFISDLHLCGARPAITGLFLDFLQRRARTADALYILGDLFEYWIGDEAVEQEEFRTIVHGLRELTTSGTPVFVMHGNRDFLMADGFEKATGCRLLSDPSRIDLYGMPTLLMHGDTLCVDDIEYMNFRAQVRNPAWQKEFLGKSVAERDRIVRDFREISKNSTAAKKPEIMDANPKAVETVMREHRVQRLIHGHTHRPKEHVFDLDGRPAWRMVLGDWYEQGSVLSVDARGWALEGLPLKTSMKSEKLKVKR
ncbi:MAG: UDP-2,3-diacylglucosamine diphosphatase [Candidatus Muproteobacteria bacterium RIFCSPHIGHO2_12_FULL_60_33]|uniref:UDP-2,3-diacylglucosamine hydrolase n=1 Tax=Candidatus Muproteobacteria bacterium RIFCSPLOWO2_01_FULL_60_18 TaxID=1817768 RepID=A0A1F6TZM5_9PROT|nr:MAG: UDP-2,3-diacylglucosamine diphosphatase [Candidatus Muproteobacteria bacterium RIFCSPHIGHO2_01_60_12]OGI50566.1 MAG: UDP-2,3-diacylglucosamine diphosphatase [Candidatus Muproteobacteria bacterium RIFCSPLOWO2_01_FULL_60_18]OGI56086.1 MAG: UDP-2,3-diacylglucosamine diphosphatase [Candidatus Muproteobacteria bacterium RIFCSPHIGHO2_12_FULL_60_33]OGI56092.1 MAG: UDP-2,3-diacylglucosamine diphosphatase [Candidatus Muproteobacteria bacterium RIFCSPHIGHO2_02_FULL_60_13]OGI60765.1 MAG: UDP-2,3-d